MSTLKQKDKIEKYNGILLRKLSVFLNNEPDLIKEEKITEIARQCSLDRECAYMYMLASALYLDVANDREDAEMFRLYFPDMVFELDAGEYECDSYMLEILVPSVKLGSWELCTMHYAPYEAFVFDDFKYTDDGRVIAQIGYFPRRYDYPCVKHDGREWMLITPNEINTMREPISRARGKVLTFGLGLGYFAFMAAKKDEVERVDVVEIDEEVIELFVRYILPQMDVKDKINVIRADAYEFAERELTDGSYDFVFCDIWHDASDGVSAYKRLKEYAKKAPNTEFAYWIEKTLKYYM